MRIWALALLPLIGLGPVSCGPGNVGEERSYASALPERGWMELCANENRAGNSTRCTDQSVLWVVTFTGQQTPQDITALLGPRAEGVTIHAHLEAPLNTQVEEIRGRTMFLRGVATADRDGDGVASVRMENAEILGFQTMVGGPKQGALAPDLTLAEYGRYCLLASVGMYTDQCAGRSVLWYGLLRGAAPDGVILGLPFEDATIARIKTAEPLTWPIGDTRPLADQPVVIAGVLGPYQARRDNAERVPVVEGARIINFSQRTEPAEDITGAP